MKFFRGFLVFGLLLMGNYSLSFAGEIKGLSVTPSDSYLNVVWTPISESDAGGDFEGYSVQWSLKQDDIRNDKYAKKYLAQNSFSVRRASFSLNTFYYFRVYTYTINDAGKKILDNGSKILKWKISSGSVVETSELTANDPVIAAVSSSSSSDSSSAFDFGVLRVKEYDTFADFSWSRPSGMAKTDYDGFKITVSKSADLSSPVGEFKLDRSVFKLRVKDMSPSSTYYVSGSFYKGTKSFAKGQTETVKTIAAIDRSTYSRESRGIKRVEKQAVFSKSLGDSGETTTTNASTTNSTTTSGLSSTATSSSKLTSSSDIRSRIAALKSKIKSLEKEIATLERKLPGSSRTTSSSRTTTSKTTSSSKLSLRERIRARLNAKNK